VKRSRTRGLVFPTVIGLVAALAGACGGSGSTGTSLSTSTSESPVTTLQPATTTTADNRTTTTTDAATTTTEPATTTTDAPPPGDVTISLASASELNGDWTEVFVIGYGPGDELLGTSPGGDSGSLQLGPEYGTQAADGTWWFLDGAKLRLAHYSEGGSYLGSVPVPPDLLSDGVYFQYQLPHALDNGTIVASRLGFDSSKLLLLGDGAISAVELATPFVATTDDGVMLYGSNDTGELLRADPISGSVSTTEWLGSRSGARYRVIARGDEVTVELPDSLSGQVVLHLVYAADPTVPAYAGVEVETGIDGSVYLFLYGGTDSGEGGQLAGFVAIKPDGTVLPAEPSRDPFSPADPGSPAHLGMRPGASVPWLMFVDVDGVHVFQRA